MKYIDLINYSGMIIAFFLGYTYHKKEKAIKNFIRTIISFFITSKVIILIKKLIMSFLSVSSLIKILKGVIRHMMSDIILEGLLDIISIVPACVCVAILLLFLGKMLK